MMIDDVYITDYYKRLNNLLTVETEVTHLQDDAATRILLYLGQDANELATQCS